MEAEKIVKRSRRRQKVPVEESQLVKLKEEEIEEQDKIVKMQSISQLQDRQQGQQRSARKASEKRKLICKKKTLPAPDATTTIIEPQKENVQHVQSATKQPILHSDIYHPVSEIDLNIFAAYLAKTKIYSVMLVNEFGQILFTDKLASEHYEGSLNNLTRTPVQNLILQRQSAEIVEHLRALRNYHEQTCVRFIIYSKNFKRRYSSMTLVNYYSPRDIFYRFLKCLVARMRPIEINIKNFADFDGMWNRQLLPMGQPIKCFLWETRLASRLPELSGLKLREDRVIKRYIEISNRKHQHRLQHSLCKMEDEENPLPHKDRTKNPIKYEFYEQEEEEFLVPMRATERSLADHNCLDNSVVVKCEAD